MAKTWMKFTCEDCGTENWLKEDIETLKDDRALIYCSKCGHVRGFVDRIESNNEMCCKIFLDGNRKHTTGPVELEESTLWKSPDGNALTRVEYMMKYGIDPLTDWNNMQRAKRY